VQQFAVYTVVRLAGENAVDVDDEEQLRALWRPIAGIAQLEEPWHPGIAGGEVPISAAVLNRSVVAAVSQRGACRVVIDQSGAGSGFNAERFCRSRDKAFIPYLIALLQRLILDHVRDRVAAVVRIDRGQSLSRLHDPLQEPRRDLLESSASIFLPEVSQRDEFNRFYEIAQGGLRVGHAHAETERMIENLDRACKVDRQITLQERVELVEVFMIAMYSLYFSKSVGEAFIHDKVVLAGLAIAVSWLSAAIAFWLLVYRHERERSQRRSRLRGFLLVTLLAIVVVGGLGWIGKVLEQSRAARQTESRVQTTRPEPARPPH
jgi:hypothetical protein